MNLVKNLVRLGIEAALGVGVAFVISMLTMAALFTWGDQVDPPLADQLWQILPPVAVAVAVARFIWRLRDRTNASAVTTQ